MAGGLLEEIECPAPAFDGIRFGVGPFEFRGDACDGVGLGPECLSEECRFAGGGVKSGGVVSGLAGDC